MSAPSDTAGEGPAGGILARVERRIEREGLFGPREKIAVGLSGGPDSVALLHILIELQAGRAWEIHAVHVHHGIRAEEADEDARFARSVSEGTGIPFSLRSIEPDPHASEDRLRRHRYEILASEATGIGATRVAVGHNRDDQAETVIHRMARGTGFRGLAGIPYKRSLPGSGGALLVRPLLDCSRKEMIAYLESRKVSWREDRTNIDPRYTRNRIRHEVLPVLEEAVNANVREAIARLSSLARDVLPTLEAEADGILRDGARTAGPAGGIRVDSWKDQSPAVIGEALRLAFLEAGGREGSFSREMIEGLLETIRAGEGTYRGTWPGRIPVDLRGGRLLVGGEPEETDRETAPLPVPGATECPWAGVEIRSRIVSPAEMEAEGGPRGGGGRVWFDSEALSPPLEVRPWRRGEPFHPFGGPSAKEIRVVLSDEKVPRQDRPATPVVADAEGVIWIPGVRRSVRAPITKRSTRILRLERIPDYGDLV